MKQFKNIYFLSLALVLCLGFLSSCSGKSAGTGSPWQEASAWYESPTPDDAAKLDVLYLVSTDVLSAKDAEGNEVWRANLSPEDKEAMAGEIAWVEENIFYDDFNLHSPYYHQFTFDAIKLYPGESFFAVYQEVAKEVCEAFDYYMENVNKGRPFVLAGFSQGAMLTLDLLRHMTDEQFSRMVACYTIGYRVSADELQHPHINPARGETDRGVVISFNSVQSREAQWDLVSAEAAECINPVNWKTDSTPAKFTYLDFENEVRVDTDSHLLIVQSDRPDYFTAEMQRLSFFAEVGVSEQNLHHWDLLFYGKQIHDNALKRYRQ